METLGSLVDKLSIVNLKMWMQEDKKRDKNASDKQIADATRKTNILNEQRNDLIQEIDELLTKVILEGMAPKNYKQGDTKDYDSKRNM